MKPFTPPRLARHGTVRDITAAFGDPFTGDVVFDLDGNVISETPNSGANGCMVDGEVFPVVDDPGPCYP